MARSRPRKAAREKAAQACRNLQETTQAWNSQRRRLWDLAHEINGDNPPDVEASLCTAITQPQSEAGMVLNTPSPSISLVFNWWSFALRGMLAFAFGMLALALPKLTVMLITLAFAAFAFVDGVLTLIAGCRRAGHGERWGWMVLAGLVGIAAGALAWLWPPAASLALSGFFWSVLALWTILVGAMDLATAVCLRRLMKGEWLLGLRGIVAVLLGLGLLALMLWYPTVSLVTLGWLVGWSSLFSGLALLALAYRLRQAGRDDRPSPLVRPSL